MDYLTREHAEKLQAELKLVELSIGMSQKRYAYFVQMTSGTHDRAALEAAITNLKTRRFELQMMLMTIEDYIS